MAAAALATGSALTWARPKPDAGCYRIEALVFFGLLAVAIAQIRTAWSTSAPRETAPATYRSARQCFQRTDCKRARSCRTLSPTAIFCIKA
jgi:hypothetical protein